MPNITLVDEDSIIYLPQLFTKIGKSIDFVLIDPPYGIDVLNHKWDKNKIEKLKEKANKSVVKGLPVGMKFNPEDAKELGKFLNNVAQSLIKLIKPGGFCVVFSQARSCHRVACAFEDVGFEVREQLIWLHNHGQSKAQGMANFIKKSKISEKDKEVFLNKMEGFKTPQFTPTFETMWLFQSPKEGLFWENFIKYNVGLINLKNGSKKTSFEFKKPNKKERIEANFHPTLKPVKLLEELIRTFCPDNGLVLDCFMGSGTTGIACVNTNRNFIGIEKEKEYFYIAEKRIGDTVEIFKKTITENKK